MYFFKFGIVYEIFLNYLLLEVIFKLVCLKLKIIEKKLFFLIKLFNWL